MGAYDELIGQLQAYKGQLDAPQQHTNAVAGGQPPAALTNAKQGLEATLGEIPLPMDHPGWQAIAGAVMGAMGSVDGAIDMWQEVANKAREATQAIVQAQQEVDQVIQSFQQ